MGVDSEDSSCGVCCEAAPLSGRSALYHSSPKSSSLLPFLFLPSLKMQVRSKQNYTLLPRGDAEKLSTPPQSKLRNKWIWKWIISAIIIKTALLALLFSSRSHGDRQNPLPSGHSACPQYPPVKALSSDKQKFQDEVKDVIDSDKFFEMSLKRMQGAVQIPTESFDDMGKVGNDSRWNIFKELHSYLEEMFPLV